MSVTAAGWDELWRALGARAGDQALFRRLVAAYSEPHRHYHTLQHLRECLTQWEAARAMAQRPAEIALALWFHDGVYDPHRDDNEQRSADWASESMLAAGLARAAAQRVHAMVMATRHQALPRQADARLAVDADLAILGAPPARFDESSAQVRREYAHVPADEYRAGRRRVLQQFLDRPRIYGTGFFHQRYETQARANLAREMAALAAPTEAALGAAPAVH